ncbi:MAG: NAD(P)H-dependent oxidoreductase subunit E [Chloroflexi bacterium]|nr:NAD(P)H-dependent oxidoreductase subunit E [Chloroflexota bacterium]
MAAEPTTRELRELVAEYEFERGHLLPALIEIQERYGYVSPEAIEVLARQMRTTPALVYGAVSFYADFRTEPPPEREIAWCSGPACRILGGDRIREALQHTLGLALDSQSEDGAYGLRLGQCNGTCSEAPQVWLDGEVVGDLTVAKAVAIARDVKGDA